MSKIAIPVVQRWPKSAGNCAKPSRPVPQRGTVRPDRPILMRRALVLLAIVLMGLLGIAPGSLGASAARAQSASAVQGQWQPGEDEQWLFDLRTERLRIGEGVRGYADGARSCVILSDIITTLDLPIRLDPQLGRATGWAFDERRTLDIDREQGRVTIASRSTAIPVGTIVDTRAGWCVDPVQLGEWLGVAMTADLANSILRMRSEQPLPFELAAQRRTRAASIRPDRDFSLASLPRATRPYQAWQMPSVDAVASVALIHDASTGRTVTQARYELYASGELLGASFDARLASNDVGLPDSLRVRAYRSDPDGRLLGPLRATTVAAGDVSSLSSPIGVQPVAGRGAMISNRALDLPDSFDRTTFRGELPAGWEAELYRNGQLLAFSTPDGRGRYEFIDVRLIYGLNRFEIVLYGPQGQVRRELRMVPVGIDAIPPGRFYYWAAALEEGRDLIRLSRDRRTIRPGWRGTLGLEYGIDKRTSAGLWLSNFTQSGRRLSMAEAALRRSVGPTLVELTGSGQSGGGMAARLLWAGQFGQNYFSVESVVARGGYVSDRISEGTSGWHSLALDLSPRFGNAVLPVHLEASYRTRFDGQNRLAADARMSANWRNMSFTGRLGWAQTQGSGANDGAMVAGLLANARFGRLRLRGEAEVAVSGPGANNHVSATAEWAQSDRTDWRVETGYDAAAGRVRLGAGWQRRFRALALNAVAEAASDGSVAASFGVALSFGPDPRGGGMRVTRDRLASQGQALATVFFDDNADGVRQPGESLAENVTLTAGNAVSDTPTGADGLAIVDALTPFRPVLIGIDESSLPNPLVRPTMAGVVIVPRPGVATPVLLPLVSTGEVEGTLVRAGGNGIEGVDIELVDSHGVIRATTRSDFDGFFLFESVPYGRYQLRIGVLTAQVLAVDAPIGNVTLDRTHQRQRLGTIALAARSQMVSTTPTGRSAAPGR